MIDFLNQLKFLQNHSKSESEKYREKDFSLNSQYIVNLQHMINTNFRGCFKSMMVE